MDEISGIFTLRGQDIETRQILLARHSILKIGRTAANDIQLNSPQISREHLQIWWEDGGFYVKDLGSRNGVWIDGARLPEEGHKRLMKGMKIQFGPFALEFEGLSTPSFDQPSDYSDRAVSSPVSGNGDAGGYGDGRGSGYSDDGGYGGTIEQYANGGSDGDNSGGGEIEGVYGSRPNRSGSTTPAATSNRRRDFQPGVSTGAIKAGQPRPNHQVRRPSPIEQRLVSQLKPRPQIVRMPAERSNWLQYLPAIFSDPMPDRNDTNHNDFLGRYLMIFESILNPITWMIDNFDLYLSPETAPDLWLEWLGGWFDILLVPELPQERKREILRQTEWLYLRRGTRQGMRRLLELYFGVPVEIVEFPDRPCEFEVRMALDDSDLALPDDIKRDLAQHLIDTQKPGFATGHLNNSKR